MEQRANIVEKGAQTLVLLTDIWNETGLPEDERAAYLTNLSKLVCALYDKALEDTRRSRGTSCQDPLK